MYNDNPNSNFRPWHSFFAHAFLNPFLFLIIIFTADTLGVRLDTPTDLRNVSTLRFDLFTPISLVAYAAWTSLFYLLFVRLKKDRSLHKFLELSFNFRLPLLLIPVVPQLLGFLTLAVCAVGMDGNTMGFIFFPLLILGSIIQLVCLVIKVRRIMTS